MGNTPPHLRDVVRTFWVGPPLSFYEILSLKSFLATGARVIVYAYDERLVVPDGIELRNAGEIVPLDILEHYNSGNPDAWARHSDLFRYTMLEKVGGWYADLDIVCLSDELPPDEIYLGRADEKQVFASLLKLPKGLPALRELVREAKKILPQAGEVESSKARAVIGTPLVSRVLRNAGLDQFAKPTSDAYELRFNEALSFFDPKQCNSIQSRLAKSTFTHLWNGAWNRLRIPRNYGPPAGSFLDVLFKRFDVEVPTQGRLKYESIASWAMEDCILEEYRLRVGKSEASKSELDAFAEALDRDGWDPRERLYRPSPTQAPPEKTIPKSVDPQIVRTFWHGATMSPYQQACLQSFVDRGHRVEVFSYSLERKLAQDFHARDAREILPEARVLRPLAGGNLGIHANLFRYALLERLGGWWIDPDVMLMQPELPRGDIYLASPDVFRRTPVAVLKFPAGHPLMTEARRRADALDDHPDEWERAGAQLLSELVSSGDIAHQEELGPISWLNVPDLFDPRKHDELYRLAANSRFLHMQDEVWRRAGIPSQLGPPEGSYLADLLGNQGIGASFAAHMTFDQVNRWVRHMYRAAGLDRS